ncbi:hypothetical protein INH39_21695 [Massilia violaceinigra]|uniref:Uncharacterized protein n=1 Tax=Massilia violaceinigra TaxID=2045208 RepID=A0ABY3ZZZ7_9BURK|nr:hypothetical protein [Massilia violaceinigra]UOD28070.1 hypothetical protein INH39_21695 [Massilia violaceinigra]
MPTLHPSTDIAFSRPPGRWLTIGIVIGLHAALLLAWRHTREQAPLRGEDNSPRIQWIDTVAPKAVAPTPATRPVPAASASGEPVRTARARRDPPVRAAPPAPAITVPAGTGSEAPAIAVLPPDPFANEPAPAAPASGADAIRKRALADLAKIDKDLRKASLNKFAVPDDSPQKRLIAGIESARRNPTLFEKAEIEEITTGNSDGGGRKYKIKTALGTYCVTYPSATDPMGSKKYTLCPN